MLDEDAVLYEAEKHPKEEDALTKPQRDVAEDGTVTITTTATMPVETILYSDESDESDEYGDSDSDVDSDGDGHSDHSPAALKRQNKVKLDLDDPNSVYLGLRVYSHKDVQVEITSRLLGDD